MTKMSQRKKNRSVLQ